MQNVNRFGLFLASLFSKDFDQIDEELRRLQGEDRDRGRPMLNRAALKGRTLK